MLSAASSSAFRASSVTHSTAISRHNFADLLSVTDEWNMPQGTPNGRQSSISYEIVTNSSRSHRIEISPEISAKLPPTLSSGPEKAYAMAMGVRRSNTVMWQEIGNPVSEDFVTLIVVAMLTSMTIVLSLFGS
jgi:hypothetical protein